MVWGDTDGDGAFTSLDVLFMEAYLLVAGLPGNPPVCTVTCQSQQAMSAWQLSQLNPLRNPNSPAQTGTESDLQLLLLTLVGKAFFLTRLGVQVQAGALQASIVLTDYNGVTNPPNALGAVVLWTSSNRYLSFDTPFSLDNTTGAVTIQCSSRGGNLGIASLPSSVPVDEAGVGLQVISDSIDPNGNLVGTFSYLPGNSPVTTFNILASNTTLAPTVQPVYIPVVVCADLCQSAVGLFLDFTTNDPQWLDAHTLSVRFAFELPALQGYPFQPGPGQPPAVQTLSFSSPGPGELFVGETFTVRFVPPNTTTLGLYKTTGASLVSVGGGDRIGQYFLVQDGTPVNMTFTVTNEGQNTIQVWAVQEMQEKTVAAKPQGPLLSASVTGRGTGLLSLQVQPLCASAIQWSVWGGNDEVCAVQLTPVWYNGPGQSSVLNCTSYPCQLSFLGRTITPSVPVLRPTRPELRVQKTLVARNERAHWRAHCTLQGQRVAINTRALRAGLVTVSPPNALTISNGSFSGTIPGMATLTFARNVSFAINVSTALDPPIRLDAWLFRQAVYSLGTGNLNVTFMPPDFQSGDRAYLLAQASYANGFSIALSQGLDQALAVTPGPNMTIARDGSILLAQYALGPSSVQVSFLGLSTTVGFQVQPVTPVRLDACCNQSLVTYPGSPAQGLAGIQTVFSLTSLAVVLPRGVSVPLGMDDPRVSESHDSRVLMYSNGVWAVWSSTEVHMGSTAITITYTQPGSLAQAVARVYLQVVDARGLVLNASYPWGGGAGVIRRLHCSAVFQRVVYTAALDLGPVQPDVTEDLQISVSNQSVLAPSGQSVTGLGEGTAMVTIFGRGFVYAQRIRVLDQSVPVVGLDTPCFENLYGAVGTTLPFGLTGQLLTGESLQDLETVVPVLANTDAPLALTGTTLTLLRSTPLGKASFIRFELFPCLGFQPVIQRPVQVTALATSGTVDVQVEPVTSSGLEAQASLTGANVLAFYMELWTDAGVIDCGPPSPALEGLFVCNVDSALSKAVFAGVLSKTYPTPVAVGVFRMANPPLWLSGVLETTDTNLATRQASIIAGQMGDPPFTPSLAPLPVVDSGSLARQYLPCLTTGSGLLPALLQSALLLVGRTLNVAMHLYSNDFELSAMLRVTDRFLQPVNEPNLVLTVLFRTDQLQDLDGANQTQDGLQALAKFVQDGWFVVEWTQAIPQLNVSVSYSLCTAPGGGWQSLSVWDAPGLLATGMPLAQCPRGAYAQGVIQVRYYASGNGTLAMSRRALQKIACNLRVASRRVLVSQDSEGRLSLAVAIESFNRLSEINFAVMNDWFAETIMPLLNFTPWRLVRGGVTFINDTADAYSPCPPGVYLTEDGTSTALPMHSVVGTDCYSFTCIDGFQLDQGQCIPSSFSGNLVMTILVLVLSLMVSVSLGLCVIQLLCAHRSGDDEVQLDPGDDDGTDPPDPQAQDAEVLPEVDLNALGLVRLDPYSKSMLEEQFSPLVGHR